MCDGKVSKGRSRKSYADQIGSVLKRAKFQTPETDYVREAALCADYSVPVDCVAGPAPRPSSFHEISAPKVSGYLCLPFCLSSYDYMIDFILNSYTDRLEAKEGGRDLRMLFGDIEVVNDLQTYTSWGVLKKND
ncbi:hypothetical protein EVAR_6000_1 [Eumeta japonica]|uniref:Uncharacterized protein n=1 Tax=Eumeta variegata TaxID=151549 RepID=A0A4C1T9G4_EUMVA|nr:hypothetical protein EVAR_6000_1 [Eumeta japonica]